MVNGREQGAARIRQRGRQRLARQQFQQARIQRQRERRVKNLFENVQTPEQAERLIQQLPEGQRSLARQQLQKLKKQREQKFESRIERLEKQIQRQKQREQSFAERGRSERAETAEAKAAAFQEELEKLKGLRGRSDVPFSGARRVAGAAASAELQKRSALERRERQKEQLESQLSKELGRTTARKIIRGEEVQISQKKVQQLSPETKRALRIGEPTTQQPRTELPEGAIGSAVGGGFLFESGRTPQSREVRGLNLERIQEQIRSGEIDVSGTGDVRIGGQTAQDILPERDFGAAARDIGRIVSESLQRINPDIVIRQFTQGKFRPLTSEEFQEISQRQQELEEKLGRDNLLSPQAILASAVPLGGLRGTSLRALQRAEPELGIGVSQTADDISTILAQSRRTVPSLTRQPFAQSRTLSGFRVRRLEDGTFQIEGGRGATRVRGPRLNIDDMQFTFAGEAGETTARQVRQIPGLLRQARDVPEGITPIESRIELLTRGADPRLFRGRQVALAQTQDEITRILSATPTRFRQAFPGQEQRTFINLDTGRVVRGPLSAAVRRFESGAAIREIGRDAQGRITTFQPSARTGFARAQQLERQVSGVAGKTADELALQNLRQSLSQPRLNAQTLALERLRQSVEQLQPVSPTEASEQITQQLPEDATLSQKITLQNQAKQSVRTQNNELKNLKTQLKERQRTFENKLKNQSRVQENRIKNQLRVNLQQQKNRLRKLQTQKVSQQLINQQRAAVRQARLNLRAFTQTPLKITPRPRISTRLPRRIPPRFPIPSEKKPKRKKPLVSTRRQRVQPFIKQKPAKENKFQQIGSPTTPRTALKKLTRRLDTSLRASGFLTDAKGNKLRPRRLPPGFRFSKNPKTPNLIVERKSRRLDSPREVRRIQQAKRESNLKSSPLILRRRN